MSDSPKKVYVLCHSPLGVHASQRFRLEQYIDFLASQGVELKLSPFFTIAARGFLYKKGGTLKKIFATLRGFTLRFFDLFKMGSYDYVHVIREAMPVGPPIVEWFAAKVLGKKLIYEFDDAIWMKGKTVNNIAPRNKSKTAAICKWAHRVIGGNEYLLDFARKHNQNTTYIPTTIDTARHHKSIKEHRDKEPLTIGWTGTFSNLPFLDIVMPALRKINDEKSIRFLVVCNQAPKHGDSFIDYKEWKAESEIEDLLQMDIGLMPLENNEWSKGKCGFKILQYLALGIPAVATPVGVNAEIVEEGVSGFLCSTEKEWEVALRKLIAESGLRNRFGKAGRAKVEQDFSVAHWESAYLNLYRD